MSKKSLVALAHGLDVQENVTRVFDMMGGAAKMIEPNSTVVLKPNAGHAAPPEFAVCTHPETVRAVIREVKKANPKRIVIAEAAAVGCDTDECYEACGIAAVAREEGVELVDIKKDKDLINVAVRGYRSNISHVKLPRLLLEAEHIINLPILKAHASMVFSGALGAGSGPCSDAPAEPDHGHDGRVVGLPRRHQHHGRDARRQRLLPPHPRAHRGGLHHGLL